MEKKTVTVQRSLRRRGQHPDKAIPGPFQVEIPESGGGSLLQTTNLLTEPRRFLLEEVEAAVMFERIGRTVREQWHARMRSAGVSEGDCEAIRSAFVYGGLFYENTVQAQRFGRHDSPEASKLCWRRGRRVPGSRTGAARPSGLEKFGVVWHPDMRQG